jgi:hypothetical protein
MRAEPLLGALRHLLAACALSAAALLGFLQPVAAQADSYAQKWNPWVELGGLGADDDGSRALGELWMPLLQGPSALFFFDGKFQFFEEDVREINAALGLRKMTASGWNLGAWFSGDLRETSNDNSFWQVAGGLEALSVKWDLRVNGYLPVTDPQASPSTAEVILQRNTIFMIGGQEVALHGFDGEVGYMLLGSPETKPGTRHELRVYGGGFWFDDEDAIDEVAGPSARLEWRIDDLIPDWGGSRLTFDAGYSHDEVRGDLWQVGGRLRIPLGGTRTYALLSPQARRMQERIERDDDIIVVESGPENVFDTLTGVRFDRVAYVNPSITKVSAEAGDNSLLILNGTVSGPQALQGNQTLMGGKSTIDGREIRRHQTLYRPRLNRASDRSRPRPQSHAAWQQHPRRRPRHSRHANGLSSLRQCGGHFGPGALQQRRDRAEPDRRYWLLRHQPRRPEQQCPHFRHHYRQWGDAWRHLPRHRQQRHRGFPRCDLGYGGFRNFLRHRQPSRQHCRHHDLRGRHDRHCHRQ